MMMLWLGISGFLIVIFTVFVINPFIWFIMMLIKKEQSEEDYDIYM